MDVTTKEKVSLKYGFFMLFFYSRYKAFHDAFFDSSGLVGRRQMFKFDCKVLEKFYPDKFNAEAYSKRLKHLMQRYNNSALETLNLALNFVEKHSYKELLSYWEILETLVHEELEVQSKINSSLNNLTPKTASY